MAYGIFVPRLGIEPVPLQWKHEILTTGPPGESLDSPTATAAAKSLQSCPTRCNPIDGSPPGSPVPGILQARTLEWVAIPSPMRESEK